MLWFLVFKTEPFLIGLLRGLSEFIHLKCLAQCSVNVSNYYLEKQRGEFSFFDYPASKSLPLGWVLVGSRVYPAHKRQKADLEQPNTEPPPEILILRVQDEMPGHAYR